jgi:hypothetical protein
MSKQRRPSRPATPSAPGGAPARLRAPAPTRAGLQGAAGFSPRPVVQRKLKVGSLGDAFEREADQVADRVVSGQPAPAISRLPASGLPAPAQRAAAEPATGMEEENAEAVQAATEEDEIAQTEQAPVEEEEAVQTESTDEEEVAQTAGTADEELAQTRPEEEDLVQAQAEDEEAQDLAQTETEEENEAPVQAKPRGPREPRPVRDGSEAEAAIRSPGLGRPLPRDVQTRIERSTGADLSDVRVHDDAASGRAARALDARAFAHDRDIWLGAGESARDTRLMAHEAAHVVQQTGRGRTSAGPARPAGASAASVQRQEPTPSAPPTELRSTAGVIDLTGNKKMTIPEISLPDKANKQTTAGDLIARPPGRTANDQRQKWLNEISGPGLGTVLDTKLPDDKAIPTVGGQRIYYLKTKAQNMFLVGDREQIRSQIRLPNWTRRGANEQFQVDHVHEQQLGGPHELSNFQLLDAETNRASGNAIRQEIKERIDAAVAPHVGPDKYWPRAPSADSLRGSFGEIRFTTKSSRNLSITGRDNHWTKAQVADQGAHLDAFDVLTAAQVRTAGVDLVGSATRLVVYPAQGAGRPKHIVWGPQGPRNLPLNWVTGLRVTGASYTPGEGGSLSVEAFRNNKVIENSQFDVSLEEVPGLNYTVRVGGDLRALLRNRLRGKGLSPITVDDAFIGDDSFVVSGHLSPSPAIFKRDLSIDLTIDGNDVSLSKTFTAGEFELPGPVAITDSSLTVSAGTRGLAISGELNFEVDRVGKGALRGAASTATGFAVEGEFDFDPALFRGADARIRVRYAEDKFSGEGTLRIGDGQIKGIRSAAIAVKLEDGAWTADGTVQPKIPGVSEGSLSMVFNPDGGFEITGRLTLGEGIPRLRSGHLEATLRKEEEAYILSGRGRAEFDIPGIAAGIDAEYRDGLFRAEATVGFQRGMARGSVTVGATNMPVDDGGTPAGEPGERMSIYGQGSVTIRFTPWLEGTAGIKLAPDGQIEVRGRIALPDSVEVFPQRRLERQLVSIGVDIPIVGVSVARQRIGIFLNIGGSLTAHASIGPGTLEDAAVEVTYNPEDEAASRVTGTARFVVPAEAGLRLAIRGAIGAGIPVVSAQAGLEIGGQLGIEGEASAGAEVEWSPATGISMEADVSLLAQPKFTFDLTGFVEVTADLLLTTIDLYSKRWKLAAVEYGSAMQVGVKLKAKVENNQFKPISLDDVEFITPKIDPVETAKGLIRASS